MLREMPDLYYIHREVDGHSSFRMMHNRSLKCSVHSLIQTDALRLVLTRHYFFNKQEGLLLLSKTALAHEKHAEYQRGGEKRHIKKNLFRGSSSLFVSNFF